MCGDLPAPQRPTHLSSESTETEQENFAKLLELFLPQIDKNGANEVRREGRVVVVEVVAVVEVLVRKEEEALEAGLTLQIRSLGCWLWGSGGDTTTATTAPAATYAAGGAVAGTEATVGASARRPAPT
ncbi:unnamed protein product [Closterium sp. NIES-54]